MSRKALLLAVRDELWEQFGWTQKECQVAFNGQPPPRAGKVFVAVHRGPRQSVSDLSLEEDYTVYVTVTARVNEPYDRIGTDLMEKATEGVDDLCDRIRALLHMKDTVLDRANEALGVTVNGFCEPLMFLGDEEPQLVGGAWFHADPAATEIGVAVRLRFGKAKRIQYCEEAHDSRT